MSVYWQLGNYVCEMMQLLASKRAIQLSEQPTMHETFQNLIHIAVSYVHEKLSMNICEQIIIIFLQSYWHIVYINANIINSSSQLLLE